MRMLLVILSGLEYRESAQALKPSRVVGMLYPVEQNIYNSQNLTKQKNLQKGGFFKVIPLGIHPTKCMFTKKVLGHSFA